MRSIHGHFLAIQLLGEIFSDYVPYVFETLLTSFQVVEVTPVGFEDISYQYL